MPGGVRLEGGYGNKVVLSYAAMPGTVSQVKLCKNLITDKFNESKPSGRQEHCTTNLLIKRQEVPVQESSPNNMYKRDRSLQDLRVDRGATCQFREVREVG